MKEIDVADVKKNLAICADTMPVETTAGVIRALLKAEREAQRWIPVEEKLPEIYRPVLMAFKHHWNQVAGFYAGKGEWWQHTASDHNQKLSVTPTHWMSVAKVPHHHQDITPEVTK